ncbi:MAG: ABC transporter ATP-binding protein, partial [Eggerthellaceae bacterium]|nr:ABC transporter ATP-binding protein [Eggerthellaceae bacterium]
TNDVDVLGQTMSQGLTQLITSVVTIIGVLVMMLLINPVITLVVLALVPITGILVAILVKISQKYFMRQQNTLGEINGIVEETFSGHAIVKAFNGQSAAFAKFAASNDKLYDAAWKANFATSFMKPVMDFVGNLGYVGVAILGSVFVVQGAIAVGDIQAFIQYERNFISPLQQLAQISNMFQQMAAAAERIFDFLDLPEEDDEKEKLGAIDVDHIACDVEFEHARFGYDPQNPVIKDFSASVKEGQTVALVGHTGAGKTTIVKLLMRFYDVQSGSIRIGGHDIKDMPRDEVRGLFGMVLQDTWLFNGSIKENIAYGVEGATDEEIIASAKAAGTHHFITTLPGGYDFVINEDASNLSRGQLQLLTIARAFLANRRMLILDEATSSVDTATEERIREAMDTLMKGRTCFVIAHRLSTIRSADLILVIDNGDIAEQGTHEQLLEKNGVYAELYNSQFENCE